MKPFLVTLMPGYGMTLTEEGLNAVVRRLQDERYVDLKDQQYVAAMVQYIIKSRRDLETSTTTQNAAPQQVSADGGTTMIGGMAVSTRSLEAARIQNAKSLTDEQFLAECTLIGQGAKAMLDAVGSISYENARHAMTIASGIASSRRA